MVQRLSPSTQFPRLHEAKFQQTSERMQVPLLNRSNRHVLVIILGKSVRFWDSGDGSTVAILLRHPLLSLSFNYAGKNYDVLVWHIRRENFADLLAFSSFPELEHNSNCISCFVSSSKLYKRFIKCSATSAGFWAKAIKDFTRSYSHWAYCFH